MCYYKEIRNKYYLFLGYPYYKLDLYEIIIQIEDYTKMNVSTTLFDFIIKIYTSTTFFH